MRRTAVLMVTTASCAPTVNLLNPTSPKFEGNFATAGVAPAAPVTALRVVSFNIKLADRITEAIQVLRGGALRDADIIALQEMDETGVTRIARTLHLNYIYYPGSIHPVRHRYYGPAILTRWPVEETRKLILPHAGRIRQQRRNATAATVNVGGTRIRVYAVHLETQLRVSEYERQDQAAAILADAATRPEPVIIAGDFNSWGIGRYFERQGYAWPTKRVGKTIAFFSWDHIFVRGLSLADSAAVGRVREVHGASDHHPVWATLIVTAPGPIEPRSTVRPPNDLYNGKPVAPSILWSTGYGSGSRGCSNRTCRPRSRWN